MDTTTCRFDGVDLIVPAEDAFGWPCHDFNGFPSACGAGYQGAIRERLVPETILGLKVSPACWVHDWMWSSEHPTWQAYHHSNAVLLLNLLAINSARGGWWPVRQARLPLILAWYVAVSSPVGAVHYISGGSVNG